MCMLYDRRLLCLTLMGFALFITVLAFSPASAADNPGSAGPLAWALKPPGSAISLEPGQGIPIGVAVGSVPANKVTLLQSGVVEQSRKALLGAEGFELCRNAKDRCESQIDLPANSATTIWLRAKNSNGLVGHFIGPVTIASSLKQDGEAVTLDIYVTEGWRQLLGAIAILIGVGLAWVISTWGRARYNRDQLLLPAAFLREKLNGLRMTLDQAPAPVQHASLNNTSQRIDILLKQLEDKALTGAGYIPPAFPTPYAGTPLRTDDYKQFLQKMDDWIAVLRAVVENGMAVAWGQLTANSSPGAQQEVDKSIARIDGLVIGSTPPVLANVNNQIAAELTNLHNTLTNVRHVARVGARALTSPAASPQSYDDLRLELHSISVAAWSAAAILTMLVGTYVVVLSNLGFGLWTDYLICVFWGLGLPIGAQQIMQQTTGSVSSTLGISVSK